jgi:hypothetical protein
MTAIGGSMALFSTFFPWYAFEVVLPTARVVHIFAVSTTLWALTTLAPILIIVGAFVALIAIVLAPRPLAHIIVGLIGLAMIVYGVVRVFDVPDLGVQVLPGGVRAITQLEGGPFIELSGGILLVLGAVGDLLGAPIGATSPTARRWRGPSSVPPAPAAG